MIARSPALPVAMTSRQVYTSEFWLSYTANTMLVAATALLFRFAEFIKFLDGTEETAGRVIAVGVCASLTLRFFLGQAIDHFGVRRSWIASAIVCTIGSAMFMTVSDIGPLLYASRAVFATGVACCFACSISYIQSLVSEDRRTEVIGALGSSGFVGMIVGSNLGDIVFLVHNAQNWQLFEILFGATAALAALYFVMVCYITHGDVYERPQHTPGAHRLLWKYWPGSVVLVALMMGTGISVTTVFLSRFVTEQGLPGIRTFFTVYAITAFVVRIISRGWSRQIGRHRVLLIGLAGHALGNLLFPLVTAEWHLLFPAIACGCGHALLFPCVVSIGAGAFPPEYRGTGTTMILGFVDLGTILSAPLLGRIIDHHGFEPMFITSASVSLVILVIYGFLTRDHVCSDQQMFLESDDDAVQEMAAVTACDAGIVGETPSTWNHTSGEAAEACRPAL
jgi:MFS family permease